MAKFADTPEWRRRQRWDPKRQQFIDGRRASPKQMRLIRALADEVGATMPIKRLSMKDASAEIDRLLSRKRKRIFGRAATARRK